MSPYITAGRKPGQIVGHSHAQTILFISKYISHGCFLQDVVSNCGWETTDYDWDKVPLVTQDYEVEDVNDLKKAIKCDAPNSLQDYDTMNLVDNY
ncbi:9282_t:CDS:2 [Paraglomus occultum]|uniref:9282_t:CDS:1 n=1 Tax=Paraglomus occultum TaxID=144539 RepID=A0A9N9G9V2_9GLOM|nr:9282_t:CDS:2 [Paraglomus occultum]